MAHPRKLIRQAVVALLITASTAAGARVRGTRVDPHKKGGLPAIGVYTLNDTVDEDKATQTEDTHDLTLEVAGWVAHTDQIPADDAMDDLAEQIEAAMAVDPYLGGKAGNVRLLQTEMEIVEENGASDPLIGIVVLTYAIEYRSSLTVSTALDDFETVGTTDVPGGGVPDTVPVSDLFTVEETP